ncbi:MAG: UDP-4-amino-4,6-dideoxy-N-acetyl-beta-L-altrosamine transaminase [Mariniblastus sp.]|nr:UDP-4-amino-4,6-dideoxy-N-acetyl-beta-L-altrosamine transaminase [Mariniblastus sp.]
MLPYGKQTIGQDDIDAVIEVLQSDWLTTGPKVIEFESQFAQTTGVSQAVAVSSGTAALHCAMFGAGIGKTESEEVIVPSITFVATSNAAIYQGAKPVFADVDPKTLLIDPDDVRRKITSRTTAIVAMDYAGQPCDYEALRAIANEYNLVLISDACHSLGGYLDEQPIGTHADFTCFSLHPVKQITSGEGGMVVTHDAPAAARMREFRNHGITTDFRAREKLAKHQYAMESLGFNYRLTDIQCALGLSQLSKLARFTRRRNDIARFYRVLLSEVEHIETLPTRQGVLNAHHLFVIKWNAQLSGVTRDKAFKAMRERGVGVNVHYQPVYQHPFYIRQFGDQNGSCPNAEAAYSQILSLPIFPGMIETDVRRVVTELQEIGKFNVPKRKAA